MSESLIAFLGVCGGMAAMLLAYLFFLWVIIRGTVDEEEDD